MLTSSSHLQVSVGSDHSPFINSTALSSGNVRFNPITNRLEVFDGGSNRWQELIGEFVNIGFSLDIEETLEWAKQAMRKEREWLRLAEGNEAVKLALEKYEEAKKSLEITAYLSSQNKP